MAARILIIEDEAPIRRLMTLALEASGYEVAAEPDGPAGLARLAREPGWAVVLLDQRMPGMDGLDVLRRLRAGGSAVPVVMVTAFASIDLAVDAMKAGATDFLRKPVTPEILRAAVAAALGREPRPQRTSVAAAAPPPARPASDIETLTMNGFRIRHDPDPEWTGAHRFRVFAGDDREGARVAVEIGPEALGRLESLTLRRFPPSGRYWLVRAENYLASYLWNEQRVPAKPLVIRDVTRDEVDEAVAWPADL